MPRMDVESRESDAGMASLTRLSAMLFAVHVIGEFLVDDQRHIAPALFGINLQHQVTPCEEVRC